MKSRWEAINDKISALSMREKYIIFGGMSGCIFYLSFMFYMSPVMEDIQKKQRTLKAQIEEKGGTQQQIGLYQGAMDKDPNQAVNESIKSTEASIAEIDQTLSELTANFISPHKMREVLQEVLRSDDTVKVTQFSVIPAEKVAIDGVPDNTDTSIFQHGIQLTLTGSYYDLQRYMARIEALPWRFYWKSFAYEVDKHPDAVLQIEITTVSTNEQFIAI